MYSNIGRKIKRLAVFVALVGIIASVVIGGIMTATAYNDYYSNEFGIAVGVAIIVVGSLISWVSGFVLYGFGQLVENSDIIARHFSRNTPSHTQAPKGNFDTQTGDPPSEPKVPVANRIQNAVDKGFIVAKGLYDKSGQHIGERAQKAQTRQTGAEGFRPNPSGVFGANRPVNNQRPAADPRLLDSQSPVNRAAQTERFGGTDVYSSSSLDDRAINQPQPTPSTQSNSFASSYEFTDQ